MDRSELTSLFEEEQSTLGVEVVPTKTRRQIPGTIKLKPWDLESDRFKTWQGIEENAVALWSWLAQGKGRKFAAVAGLVLDEDVARKTIVRPPTISMPMVGLAVEVHSVRTAQRRTAKGATTNVLVVEITQRRRGYFDQDVQKKKDSGELPTAWEENGDFRYRAGCTLLIDPVSMTVRRVIRTAGRIDDDAELERQRRFLVEGGLEPDNAYATAASALGSKEPFALLHRHGG